MAIKANASPHELALGFAVATFWAILPTPGLSILLGFATAAFVRMSKLSLAIGFAVWNPAIAVPIAVAATPIGDVLLDGWVVPEFKIGLLTDVVSVAGKTFVGSAVVASILAVIFYFVVKRAAERHQRRARERAAAQAHSAAIDSALPVDPAQVEQLRKQHQPARELIE